MKELVIGCDNAAVELKNSIIRNLREHGISVEDMGCESAQDATFYPIIAERVCTRMLVNPTENRGILLCGTGLGMCISANKIKGIRATVCHDTYSAERSVLSNDANVLCLGARVIGPELAKKIVQEWIGLTFQDGSSTPKVKAMNSLEAKNFK